MHAAMVFRSRLWLTGEGLATTPAVLSHFWFHAASDGVRVGCANQRMPFLFAFGECRQGVAA